MTSEKPKKALRGLFTKTEVNTEDINIPVINSVETIISTNSIPIIDNIAEDNDVTSHHIVNTISKQIDDSVSEIPFSFKSEQAHEEQSFSITRIQYNFDRLKSERSRWHENDYISFLQRIDNAQTEAFFLKGRLISEVKNRFYEGNKNSWKSFCEETLNMNYTTANQYIRVAEEFDVTSHQRTDFGFEHFKALLPLASQQRLRLLNDTPQNVSVKKLRTLVAASLIDQSPQQESTENLPHYNIKAFLDNLTKLKQQLNDIQNIHNLSIQDSWTLNLTLKSLGDEMISMSNILTMHLKISNKNNQVGASSSEFEDPPI